MFTGEHVRDSFAAACVEELISETEYESDVSPVLSFRSAFIIRSSSQIEMKVNRCCR